MQPITHRSTSHFHMHLPSRQRLSVFLMTLSLGLLLLFLGLFLRKVYTDELATLKRESSLLFVNSIRGIEGEMFDKIIFHTAQTITIDSVRNLSLQIPPLPSTDTAKVMMYIQGGPKEIRRDTQMRIRVMEGEQITGNPDMSGALSVMIALGNKRKVSDSLFQSGMDSTKIFAMLQQNFSQAVQNAGLPVAFRVMRMQKDSARIRADLMTPVSGETGLQMDTDLPDNANGFMAGRYTDLASGEQYGVMLSEYRSLLWRKMLPQVLFAGLLFACVTLAFLFFYQTMRRQQRLAEQKNDFIRNITHELKTPIATVSVAVEALQHFDALQEPARTREYLDISQMELARLTLLVDKVLRMSLFEKGEQEFKSEPLDLKSLVETVLNSMKVQFEQSDAQVDLQTTGSDFSLLGDRLHLTGVIYNLLDNALKYSRIKPEINISLVQETAYLSLQVCDRGIGIPPAYRTKIFEKFFRVPTGDVHNVKGHGLGLSYVDGVIRQHGGRITVDSDGRNGTCFTIVLPVGKV